MADKPRTTNPMYPQIEYVRVKRDGIEFTTTRSAVTDDMTQVKGDAVDRRGDPLPPVSHKKTKSSGGASASKPEEGSK